MQFRVSQPPSWCCWFTRHGWCHGSFQFSHRVFENVFVFFVIWIDKVNSSLSSSIVELWFFFCPFLFFSILGGFTNFRLPYMIWSGGRLNLCQTPPGPQKQCVSSNRRVFKKLLTGFSNFIFFLGFCFVKIWSEFYKRCFWVFRLIGVFFFNLCETCITVIVRFPSVFFCLELSPCALCFLLTSVGFCQFLLLNRP